MDNYKTEGLPSQTSQETSSEAENQCKDSKILQPTVPDIKENFSAVPVAEFETFEQKLKSYFERRLIDLSKEIEESEPILSIGGKRIFTRKNISCIGGMAKSRKTSLIALFTAHFLKNKDNVKVIIFDTEQSQFYAKITPKRVHGLLEWDEKQNNEQLLVFGLRELNVEERQDFIEKAITHYKPDLVFIDGIRDLVYDFNSPTESGKALQNIMALSSKENCHICTVLHANKNSEVLRGHLGTEMYNKCETIMLVVKKGNQSLVKPLYCKDIDFNEFNFTINERGLPELCNTQNEPNEPKKKSKNVEELKFLFDVLFYKNDFMTYTDLHKKIMKKCNVKETAAENKIKEAKEKDLIDKKANMYYRVKGQEEEEILDFTDESPD